MLELMCWGIPGGEADLEEGACGGGSQAYEA